MGAVPTEELQLSRAGTSDVGGLGWQACIIHRLTMANRAYLRAWTRDFSQSTMIAEFARFLTTTPLSEGPGRFRLLTVQALDASESPVAEWDLKDGNFSPAEIAALVSEYRAMDTAFLVDARWDLWSFDVEAMRWQLKAEPLLLLCQGLDYDHGVAAAEGQFAADLGFEHLFTGHAGLLHGDAAVIEPGSPDHPVEKRFRSWMASGENLKQYHQKTRENIQKLFRWVEAVEAALPVERTELWSEGEENFEARLDEIVSVK